MKSNFAKQKWKWIEVNDLKLDRNIIIKEADKGSAVVVMDAKQYTNIIQKILQNNIYIL